MKIKSIITTTITTSLFISSAYATDTGKLYTPKYLGCSENNVCYIGVIPDFTTFCDNKERVRLPMDKAGSEKMYKAAMAALTSGKKLRIATHDHPALGNPCPEDSPNARLVLVANSEQKVKKK